MTSEKMNGITTAIEIFNIKCSQLLSTRNPTIYQNDRKEKFSLWFNSGIHHTIIYPGKNQHPDSIINGIGFELKSQENISSIQFNSTIPTGRFKHKKYGIGECYYVIANYKKQSDEEYGQLQNLCMCYGDFFNHNHNFAHSHKSEKEKHFGDFGDGTVRFRKMYDFPNPIQKINGISLILDINNAHSINPNIEFEREITKMNNSTLEEHVYYVYRHKRLIVQH